MGFSTLKYEKMDFVHSFLNHARNALFSTRLSGIKMARFMHVLKKHTLDGLS